MRQTGALLATTILVAAISISVQPPRAEVDFSAEAVLPPPLPWEGRSRELIAAADDPWITPSERTGLTRTPRYAETIDWLRKLAAAAPELELVSLGRSAQGREIWMVVASRDGSTPAALGSGGKPVLLVHAGIHSGEIDGKDAGLMLLRDLTVGGTRSELLDRANLLFIPILNVDGHERFSAFGRVNQRGPVEMGWRTNARNLNLNRDFAKLDTPEVRALVRAIETWKPDLYVDVHVTDGVDYQYDITWGYNGPHGWSPNIARWLGQTLDPRLTAALTGQGHTPGPLIFAADARDIGAGIRAWTASPRFSNGYGDARHLPAVLVENHSLKPYAQRVLGTYVLLAATLEGLGRDSASLRSAVEADRRARRKRIPVGWSVPESSEREIRDFRGVESRVESSEISRSEFVRWLGRPVRIATPVLASTEPTLEIDRPPAYYIPAAWSDIAERLMLHGIRAERIDAATTVEVDMYRLPEAGIAEQRSPWTPTLFEGHVRVTPGPATVERRELRLTPGSYRIDTDQPLGDLALLLLEPQSPDSFFQWGFLLEVLNRIEYVESYIMEPLAQRMMQDDPRLAAEFRRKLADDAEFAADGRARLNWFYERTPFYDEQYRLYPIARAPGSFVGGSTDSTAGR